jgi:hypothetical protein
MLRDIQRRILRAENQFGELDLRIIYELPEETIFDSVAGQLRRFQYF